MVNSTGSFVLQVLLWFGFLFSTATSSVGIQHKSKHFTFIHSQLQSPKNVGSNKSLYFNLHTYLHLEQLQVFGFQLSLNSFLLRELQHLILKHCQLTDKMMDDIFSSSYGVEHLDLSYNTITHHGSHQLAIGNLFQVLTLFWIDCCVWKTWIFLIVQMWRSVQLISLYCIHYWIL